MTSVNFDLQWKDVVEALASGAMSGMLNPAVDDSMPADWVELNSASREAAAEVLGRLLLLPTIVRAREIAIAKAMERLSPGASHGAAGRIVRGGGS